MTKNKESILSMLNFYDTMDKKLKFVKLSFIVIGIIGLIFTIVLHNRPWGIVSLILFMMNVSGFLSLIIGGILIKRKRSILYVILLTIGLPLSFLSLFIIFQIRVG